MAKAPSNRVDGKQYLAAFRKALVETASDTRKGRLMLRARDCKTNAVGKRLIQPVKASATLTNPNWSPAAADDLSHYDGTRAAIYQALAAIEQHVDLNGLFALPLLNTGSNGPSLAAFLRSPEFRSLARTFEGQCVRIEFKASVMATTTVRTHAELFEGIGDGTEQDKRTHTAEGDWLVLPNSRDQMRMKLAGYVL